MPTPIHRFLRMPWGFPVLVLFALAGFVGNEALHARTEKAWSASARVDEVNRHAWVANYYALDRVNSLRAFLLAPDERWLARYKEANGELDRSVAFITLFLDQSGPAGRTASERLAGLFAQRSADIARALEQAQRGARDEAQATLRESDAAGRGVALRSALQEAVNIAQVDRVNADSRTLGTLNTLRWLAHALIAAMLLAAYALLRQTQLIDASREQHAERLAAEVATRTAQLRELAGHLITTREDERARLSRELHDEMGGLLSVIKLEWARLRRNPELPASMRERAEAIDRRLTEVVGLKRRVIESLRPSALDHLGLAQALSALCRDNAAAMGVPTHENLEPIELVPALELTIYRLVQEALTNVRKYSRAREVWVALRAEGEHVHVTVEDDGVGFDEASVGAGHHGIAGMRLRVESHDGRLSIGARRDGHGTRVHGVMPLRLREGAFSGEHSRAA